MANRRRAASDDPVGASDLDGDARIRVGCRRRTRHAQERTRFIGDIVELVEAATFADDVEQIAMLAAGGVGPFAGRSFRGLLEPHEHRAARRIADIADEPVVALAASVGEIMAAHRLGLARETARQV